MSPQGPGTIGALPRPAWGAVMGLLSSPEGRPKKAWRATVLELRRTCKALAELVGAGCAGGAGWLILAETAKSAAHLEAAATTGLGRALVVYVACESYDPTEPDQEALARALALAVERGHMIVFRSWLDGRAPTAALIFDAALIEASREGLLLQADFYSEEYSGSSMDAMAQLSVVELAVPERETVATLVGAGALQRISLVDAKWVDMSILSSLREVTLDKCAVEDLSPLADVPSLVLLCCRIKALPAMRNDVLVVRTSRSLRDVSGLAGGRVGHLALRLLTKVVDVSAIGAMQPPPRTVILNQMYGVQDVSMLAGIRRLEVVKCPELDKAATLAALEGKVGTILWEEED